MLSYNTAQRRSPEPEGFGKGKLEGVSAPEAANSAMTGGAMIPMLTLGIPGDPVTAVMLGALTIQGLAPGRSCSRATAVSCSRYSGRFSSRFS